MHTLYQVHILNKYKCSLWATIIITAFNIMDAVVWLLWCWQFSWQVQGI